MRKNDISKHGSILGSLRSVSSCPAKILALCFLLERLFFIGKPMCRALQYAIIPALFHQPS